MDANVKNAIPNTAKEKEFTVLELDWPLLPVQALITVETSVFYIIRPAVWPTVHHYMCHSIHKHH